ncbi:hypothetical protein HLASF_0614 [Halanaeroarchaeum sulfurireducens]|uniref:Uncharacterized protein n=2 Tax=Halanaeroarchaeum sulfurireducens TaxID=1604004 RepID=A0A0F7PA86_9EURY|nr:hypothetical protein HLASF_0614 [Halanaeroarchaeum sulfurireducens]
METARKAGLVMTPNRTQTLSALVALLVVAAVAVPAVAAADAETLAVDVEQQRDSGEAVVTVTENDTVVENATVQVTAPENYSAGEAMTTDSNGTVVLPAPNESADVTLAVAHGGTNVTRNVTLVAPAESLDVTVEQDAGERAIVTVTQYGEPVENASVTVTTEENVSYAALNETHETDVNGTVELPAPDDDLTVTVSATVDDLNATTTATLTATDLSVAATQTDDGELAIDVTEDGDHVENATVTVESGNQYEHDGTHTAPNGTLTLSPPTENVTVYVTATVEDERATTSVDLVAENDTTANNDFATSLVAFIGFLQSEDVDGPIGQHIADFVHANNPAAGNGQGPPDHAGGPNGADDAGNDTDEDDETDDDRNGPPSFANAGGPDEHDQGPPVEHAPSDERPDGENDSDDERHGPPEFVDGDDEDTEDEDSDDSGPGPPDHAAN